ncbi:MAG: TetR family transcriptional regulator [Desulfobacterales bacterium]|jgi:AcrR family transcriptional regulator|nr:TetR family transcriptional regulator [Desulfobacterales bacterium]MDD3081938.1 TetR family transcriptional regulator [Desulfobacterales bacterium]MDD3950936.1 TetR family transcriptional regulator [Desulfobacterales bacterium]MDD4464535.1 TetR family transcriptional regulator [Desulfobacterales bacterium]
MKTTYAGSEQTRDALINAAGELAADLGFANVSTRAIAGRAKANIGSIHYHFGGKDRLFEAVVQTAIRRWHEFPLSSILKPIEPILDTPKGRSRAIRAVIHRSISLLFSRKYPRWHSRVFYQLLQYRGPLQDLIKTELITPETNFLKTLFKSIRPGLSDEDALLHAVILITPVSFHADYMDAVLDALGGKANRFSKAYLQNMEDIIVRQTQLLFGLPDDRNRDDP